MKFLARAASPGPTKEDWTAVELIVVVVLQTELEVEDISWACVVVNVVVCVVVWVVVTGGAVTVVAVLWLPE